jgi:uridine kinase
VTLRAQVVVLAGPSGAGKSRLARRLGLPVLRLDDFYKNGSDPTLPRIQDGPNAGLVDWDHPDSWMPGDALAAMRSLCAAGCADVPVYDIAHDGRTGHQLLDLGSHRLFVAEGIFAQDIVAGCREAGILAAAYCVTQHPLVTFWRRLVRDLRERRKRPSVLLLRGWALMRDQSRVVGDAAAKGCLVVRPEEGYAAVRRLLQTQVS